MITDYPRLRLASIAQMPLARITAGLYQYGHECSID
jgi:hypothetical protein